MLFIFMSSYSKKSYLAIWDCAPLLEGIGYSMATIRFTAECYNVLLAAATLRIISDITQGGLKKQLTICEFNVPSDPSILCIPMVEGIIGINCTHNVTTLTSLQYYYSFAVRGLTRDPSWQTPVVNTTLLSYVVLVWFIVFILSILGLKRLKAITVNLQIVFSVIMIVLGAAILTRIEFKNHRFKYASAAEVSVKFWVEIILHASETTVLGNLIWLGSMKPDCLDPKYAAIITTPIKLFMLFLIVCATTVSTQENMVLYSITNKECFNPTGSEILMILIPDILFRCEVWQIPTVLWYSSIFFFASLSTLYSIIGLVDSIIEKFKILRRYTLVVCLILCVVGFILSITLTLNISLSIIRGWRHCGLTILTASMSLLINLAVFFIYSTRKIIDDYIFSFGRQPEKYWVALWKAAPIFTIFAFIFALTFQSSHLVTNDSNSTVIAMSYFQCSTVLLPIFIIMMGRCCKNIKQRTLDYLTKSAPSWGPANPIDNIARKKFFPQRDIKWRNAVLRCKHKCAISNNLKYVEEIMFQNRRFAQAKREMEWEVEGQIKT
ncbi:hypothetical protein Trydic_g9552 [Trypoxylus dichotomus]